MYSETHAYLMSAKCQGGQIRDHSVIVYIAACQKVPLELKKYLVQQIMLQPSLYLTLA